MCIIVVKPAGVAFPNENTLSNCWSGNQDGFGAMWRDPATGKIHINKGFMTERDMLVWTREHVESLRDTDVVMHFRFGTHGQCIPGNTHPFPITHNVKDLRATTFVCDRAIAHNGVLSTFSKTGSSLSDTMIFVKHLSNMTLQSFVGSAISKQYGKFVYMNTHDTIMFGEFCGAEGVFYSNDGYKTRSYRYRAPERGVVDFDAVDESVEGKIRGCNGDCQVCPKNKPCVWTRECDFRCDGCTLETCIHMVEAKDYEDWKKGQMDKDAGEKKDADLEAMKELKP